MGKRLVWAVKKEDLLQWNIEITGNLQCDDGGRYEPADLNGADGFSRYANRVGQFCLTEFKFGAENPDSVAEFVIHPCCLIG